MNTRYINLFRFFFHFIDLLVLNLVYLVLNSTLVRVQGFEKQYMLLYLVVNIFWLLCSYINGVYINDHHFNIQRYIRRTVSAYFLFDFTTILFIFVYHFYYSRTFVLLYFAAFGVSLLVIRFLFYQLDFLIKRNGHVNTRIVIIGHNEISQKLVSYIKEHNPNIKILGYFDETEQLQNGHALEYLGAHTGCIAFSSANNVSEIYSTLSPEKYNYVYELAHSAETNMIRFKFIPDLKMFVNRTIHIDFIQDIPVISLRAEPLEDMPSRIKKRVFDIVFSSFVIIFLLSWLFPILAILILLDSKGSVFFTQLRSGKHNKPFLCFKFRSLKMNDEKDSVQVSRNDQRFTKLGRILRKTNLDELPQFINVLMGHMSVVGPRPHMLKHTEQYSELMNEYMIRHFVNPGITGWAQVNGFRGEITNDEHLNKRVEYDIWYMENWSMLLDIKIIYMTLTNVFKGEKNAF